MLWIDFFQSKKKSQSRRLWKGERNNFPVRYGMSFWNEPARTSYNDSSSRDYIHHQRNPVCLYCVNCCAMTVLHFGQQKSNSTLTRGKMEWSIFGGGFWINKFNSKKVHHRGRASNHIKPLTLLQFVRHYYFLTDWNHNRDVRDLADYGAIFCNRNNNNNK